MKLDYSAECNISRILSAGGHSPACYREVKHLDTVYLACVPIDRSQSIQMPSPGRLVSRPHRTDGTAVNQQWWHHLANVCEINLFSSTFAVFGTSIFVVEGRICSIEPFRSSVEVSAYCSHHFLI